MVDTNNLFGSKLCTSAVQETIVDYQPDTLELIGRGPARRFFMLIFPVDQHVN